MKLEVGMYVRTKKYGIAKIIGGVTPVLRMFNIDKFKKDGINLRCQREQDVIKASHNIIDLIEVGDYVNGCYVSNKRASVNEYLGGRPKGIGIIKCNAYFNQGNYNDCKFVWIEENDIKTIVTKEQFSQMEYKISLEG